MLPGIGYCFGCSWRVLRNKSPCGGRGGGGIVLQLRIASVSPRIAGSVTNSDRESRRPNRPRQQPPPTLHHLAQ